ncbi:MAG TPA: alpha/beta hydrolase [Burkholderiaceae bacterium]|nr:alpha/beta hydrolase [Burkholderiaceae bacterium]
MLQNGASPVRMRVHARAVVARSAPLVLHFHAGAFVDGSLAQGTTVAQLLAQCGAVVASLDYPLAPAHPFPAAVEAGYAALQWLHRERRRFSGAHAPLLVAGEEAGGNLAAAVALIARDRGGPDLAGQLLLSPMLDMCVATASLRDVKAGPVGCHWADGWRQYLARADDATHPYATPGRSMRLAGLPPTLLITAQDDPLRDETQAYAGRLRDAGVAVHSHVLPAPTGLPASYLQADTAPPWADTVRAQLQQFLLSTQPTHPSRNTP